MRAGVQLGSKRQYWIIYWFVSRCMSWFCEWWDILDTYKILKVCFQKCLCRAKNFQMLLSRWKNDYIPQTDSKTEGKKSPFELLGKGKTACMHYCQRQFEGQVSLAFFQIAVKKKTPVRKLAMKLKKLAANLSMTIGISGQLLISCFSFLDMF